MEPFAHHVFICTQEKAEGVPCCGAGGSGRVLEALHRELDRQGLAEEVQVTACGCLGICDEGPAMIVYPEATWYAGITPEDVPQLVALHLRQGKTLNERARSDVAAMKSEILEHRKRYLGMLRARDAAGVLPDDVNEMIRGFMPSRAVLTALELDVFSAAGEGASSDQVAASIGGDPRATEMLLNCLVALRLLEKSDGKFRNTALSRRFFLQGSPDNARPALLHTANLWRRWTTLTDCVRAGGRVYRESNHGFVNSFIAAMDRNARERAPLVVQAVGAEKVRRMLDLGGGSAAYSIAFAKANPELRSDVLDLPEVVILAGEYISKAGLSGRIQTLPGDMLTASLPRDYDLVLISAICHMFGGEENRALLARVHGALVAGGRIVIQDFILEPDKTAPRFAALFSLNMLVGTHQGASYSEPEYGTWLRDAGFTDIRRVRLPGPSGLMIATR
jgi:(2Fe-2S) ferredoxin